MRKIASLASLAALALAAPLAHAADPVASTLTPGFSFEEYGGAQAVGAGQVDVRDTLYFIDEMSVGGLKAWYIFFDPKGGQSVEATLTFDMPLVDVFAARDALDGSNATYGIDVDGDTVFDDYASSTFIAPEPAGRFADSFSWTPGSNTLVLHFNALDPGDHIRVIVGTVPEPATCALFGAGAALFAFVARRRRPR